MSSEADEGTAPPAPSDPAAEDAPKAPSPSRRAKLVGLGLLLFVTLLCLEVVSCAGGRVLRARGNFYDPAAKGSFERFIARRDPELSWPSPAIQEPDRDASGARISPAFPDPSAPSCVSLYGDSFTYAEEVDHEHAWGNLLARRMGCRVVNHGVGGYGTDQAFLRFRRMKEDRSKTVLLGFSTVDILRNVNRFRGLIVGNTPYSFKPRFIVGQDGKLELVPMKLPMTEAEYMEIATHPDKHLAHEYFLPGGDSGVSTLTFPYLASIIGLRKDFRIRAALAGEPSHAAFFSPDHPSKGMQVTAAIAAQFAKEVAERGGWGAFVTIPIIDDLKYRKKTGALAHQPLVDALEKAGVPHLDTTPLFFAALGDRDPCSIFTKCAAGHFNEEGYRMLSDYVYDWLKEKGRL